MRKWNLKFSGTRWEDPDAFLTRLDEGRSLVRICDSDLLRVIPFFMSGIALNWFRSSKYLWRTYGDFDRACRISFSDPDLEFELRQEIYRRTQGERESVSDYLTCMKAMFDKLTPPLTESEEIRYAHRNLLPRIHLAIHRANARSFEQLQYLDMNAEKGYRVATAYRHPPTLDRSLLTELAYYEPRSRGSDRRRETVAMTNERVEYSAYDGTVDELYLSAEQFPSNRTAAPGP